MTDTDNDDICPKCNSSKASKFDDEDWSWVCMDCNVRWFLLFDGQIIVREHGKEDYMLGEEKK